MNFRVVKLEDFSGVQATIYSVILDEDEHNGTTLFDHFVTENIKKHHEEVKDIASRLKPLGIKQARATISLKTGKANPVMAFAPCSIIPRNIYDCIAYALAKVCWWLAVAVKNPGT